MASAAFVPRLIGMLHLPALPGAPRAREHLASIENRVVDEARLLARAGFDACILENFGDAPFFGDRVPPITIACMARIASRLRRECPDLPLGINVLRNDAAAALAVATASGAAFVRVNVHVGATATDQGILEGRAAETLRERRALQSPVLVWADVHVKHGRNLTHELIEQEALDCVHRGGADAVIVSGSGTGVATDLGDVRRVRDLQLGVPLYVGSGVTRDSVAEILSLADGVIVGTDLKQGGRPQAPLDAERVAAFVART